MKTAEGLAWLLDQEGRYDEAEKLGREHPDTLISMRRLAGTLLRKGRYAEAEKMQRELLDIERHVYGPEHLETLRTINNLAETLLSRRDEAFSLLRKAVDHGFPADGDLGIDKDPDLQSLHGDPRFAAVVADAKERAAAAQKLR